MNSNESIQPVETQAIADSTAKVAGAAGDPAAFEAAWEAAGMPDGDLAASGTVAPETPSLLGNIARQTSLTLDHAFNAYDPQAVSRMGMIPSIAYMAQIQIDTNYATSLVNIHWGIAKSTRQSIDAVMNSK